mgnify:CR=1 FL=1
MPSRFRAVGPLAFRAQDAPRYIPGLLLSVTCFGLNFVIALAWRHYYVRVNAKRERQFVEDQLDQETIQRLGGEAGEQDLTDLENRFFRYVKVLPTSRRCTDLVAPQLRDLIALDGPP